MQKSILITRPCYDIPTTYLHYFAGKLVKQVEEAKEYTIIDLENEKATREAFEKVIDKKRPRLIILNGHGTKNTIYGHKEQVLDEDNIHALNSSIVYAVACDSACYLGEIAVKKGGAEVYVGYESHFMVVIDETKTATLHRDKNIKPFEQVYMHFILQLISGINVNEALARTKEFIRGLIREYGVYGIRDKFGDAPLIRFGLHWDLFFLKCFGNENASF